MQIILIVLIGAPATGKTTFARSLKALKHNSCIHICYDDHIIKTIDVSQPGKWKEERLKMHHMVENLLSSLSIGNLELAPESFKATCAIISRDQPFYVIIDDNMYYRSMRYSYYQLARKYSCSFCQLFFETSMNESMEANASRDEPVSDRAIENIMLKIEPPSLENKWERHFVEVKALSDFTPSSPSFLKLAEDALNDPESPVPEIQMELPSFSMENAVDLAVRHFVAVEIDTAKKTLGLDALQKFAQELSLRKKDFLKNVKDGVILLPNDSDSIGNFVKEHFLKPV